jgi:hypothetical protein
MTSHTALPTPEQAERRSSPARRGSSSDEIGQIIDAAARALNDALDVSEAGVALMSPRDRLGALRLAALSQQPFVVRYPGCSDAIIELALKLNVADEPEAVEIVAELIGPAVVAGPIFHKPVEELTDEEWASCEHEAVSRRVAQRLLGQTDDDESAEPESAPETSEPESAPDAPAKTATEFARWAFRMTKGLNADGRLSPAALKAGLCVLDHINKDTGHCYVSEEILCIETGLPRRTLQRGFLRLKQTGWMETWRQAEFIDGRPVVCAHYRMRDDNLRAIEDQQAELKAARRARWKR